LSEGDPEQEHSHSPILFPSFVKKIWVNRSNLWVRYRHNKEDLEKSVAVYRPFLLWENEFVFLLILSRTGASVLGHVTGT
jgi:hypothetical protein